MKNSILKENRTSNIEPNGVLKATALLYLREALLKENYEECAFLIKNAKRYGAVQDDIRNVISEHVRQIVVGRQIEANNNQSRLRF